jgi:hypothetical protein
VLTGIFLVASIAFVLLTSQSLEHNIEMSKESDLNRNYLVSINQSQENMSSDVSELQTEVLRLRNQLEPRNISQAFPLYPLSSVEVFNDTYSEMKEGTIAGLPPSRPSPP